eukprot:9910735-Alexandrium_andersonii.AAC.1
MINELEDIGVGSDAIAMAAVVETVARELVVEWAENNGGVSIAAWAASAITRAAYMSAPNAEMSQGHLLALA